MNSSEAWNTFVISWYRFWVLTITSSTCPQVYSQVSVRFEFFCLKKRSNRSVQT